MPLTPKMVAAKTKEIDALTASIEDMTTAIGELLNDNFLMPMTVDECSWNSQRQQACSKQAKNLSLDSNWSPILHL